MNRNSPNSRRESEVSAMQARPVPRISIQASCETESIANPIERGDEDRRMAKAHLKVPMGRPHGNRILPVGADAKPDHLGIAP